jgi:thiamine biosynthesis lipoprotein
LAAVEYDEFRAMSSQIVLAGEGEPGAIRRGFGEAREFIEACEARLTRFSESSELAQLNRSGGSWFHASPLLFGILQQAKALMEGTGGLFDPSILEALERVGYDRSMDEIRAEGIARTRQADEMPPGALSSYELDPMEHAVRLPQGTRLDLGGIAKGWIAEEAAVRLSAFCGACAVNAGGDLFSIGRPSQGLGWEIAIEDPRDESRFLGVLRAPPGAVATSSITKRRWLQDGIHRHHLIDPRTRLPAQTDLLSVTVVAPHATTAEVFAKALLIAGSADAARLAAARKDLAFIVVDVQGRLWGPERSKELLKVGPESL